MSYLYLHLFCTEVKWVNRSKNGSFAKVKERNARSWITRHVSFTREHSLRLFIRLEFNCFTLHKLQNTFLFCRISKTGDQTANQSYSDSYLYGEWALARLNVFKRTLTGGGSITVRLTSSLDSIASLHNILSCFVESKSIAKENTILVLDLVIF